VNPSSSRLFLWIVPLVVVPHKSPRARALLRSWRSPSRRYVAEAIDEKSARGSPHLASVPLDHRIPPKQCRDQRDEPVLANRAGQDVLAASTVKSLCRPVHEIDAVLDDPTRPWSSTT
jgi:hypothetical protein